MAHIVFDLDGTIIDSRQEILKTYTLVFGKIIPLKPIDAENLNYGATINDVLKSVYGEDVSKIGEAKQLFSSVYDTSDYVETSLYEGVVYTLNELKAAGHNLYIATNKRYAPTLRILEKKNISSLFTDVAANEKAAGVTPTKRQMIQELKNKHGFEKGFFVGDSEPDIIGGKQEKLVTVAVTYGYEEKGQLMKHNPDYAIDSFIELLKLIR